MIPSGPTVRGCLRGRADGMSMVVGDSTSSASNILLTGLGSVDCIWPMRPSSACRTRREGNSRCAISKFESTNLHLVQDVRMW